MSTYVEIESFDQQRERELRERLSCLHHRGATLNYYQLQGFLFAMACSPELIKPSEWFDLIWHTDDPQFDDELEARAFYKSVVALSEHVANMARRQRYLPFAKMYDERCAVALSDWCDGLLMGHQYLEDLWMISLEDLDDPRYVDDVEVVLNLATTFADCDDAQQLTFDGELAFSEDHLPEIYEMLWRALATYASVGSLWSKHSWPFDSEQLFLALEPVAPEEPCICGSGQAFRRCCLH